MAMYDGRFKKPNIALEGTAGAQAPKVPDEFWTNCPQCKKMQLMSDVKENISVCPKCGYHYRMGAQERIEYIFDEGFEQWDAELRSANLIDFEGYDNKLEAARKSSGLNEAVITGIGKIDGMQAVGCIMEPQFMMGSMGTVVGEKIARAVEKATELRLPVIAVTVSGGARMQEGILSLMQMAKTSCAIKRHGDAGLLYIVVLTNPTTGGVTASFAMEGDIILAEPGALIGFAGPRVIEQTIRQKLPQGFQKAEFLLEKGFIDMIIERPRLREALAELLRLHGGERQ